jgi:hypothetical protein
MKIISLSSIEQETIFLQIPKINRKRDAFYLKFTNIWRQINTRPKRVGKKVLRGQGARWTSVAEPSNLMPHRSTYLLLDTKYSREHIKLRSSVEHTPRENLKIHIFPSESQMRE